MKRLRSGRETGGGNPGAVCGEPGTRPGAARSARGTEGIPGLQAGGGCQWTRTNDPEVDIVGADRGPVARRITVVGSVKWQDNRPFDVHDLARLAVHRSQVPGAGESTPLLAVARSGATVRDVPVLRPDDLMAAWRD